MNARRCVLLLAATLVGGCAPKYYAPNTHNVPLLDGPGTFAAGGAVGESRVEVQAAYAVASEIAVLLNGAFFSEEEEPSGDRGEGKLIEIGLGYHRPLSNGFHLEATGLLGVGDVENSFPSTVSANPGTSGFLDAEISRFGIQPAIGYRSPHLEAAASARLMRLNYTGIDGSLVFGGEDQGDLLMEQTGHTLLEPALTVRAGLPSVKVQLQVGWSLNLSHSDFLQDDAYATVGLVFAPGRDAAGN